MATAMAGDSHREVLRFDIGDSDDGAFWTAFRRSMRACGLAGVYWSSPTSIPGS